MWDLSMWTIYVAFELHRHSTGKKDQIERMIIILMCDEQNKFMLFHWYAREWGVLRVSYSQLMFWTKTNFWVMDERMNVHNVSSISFHFILFIYIRWVKIICLWFVINNTILYFCMVGACMVIGKYQEVGTVFTEEKGARINDLTKGRRLNQYSIMIRCSATYEPEAQCIYCMRKSHALLSCNLTYSKGQKNHYLLITIGD